MSLLESLLVLLSRVELFEVGHLDPALARFEELRLPARVGHGTAMDCLPGGTP
jgi:hypothetical protein